MVEGGGVVHTQFLADDLVDELQLVVAPFFVGDSSAPRFVSDGRFPWHATGARRSPRCARSATWCCCATPSRRGSRTNDGRAAAIRDGSGGRPDRPSAAARRPGGDRRARRGRLARRRRLRADHGDGARAGPRAQPRRAAGTGLVGDARRGTLAVLVAALVADSFARDTPVALLVALASVALVLDAVDGPLARRTGTATALGARFDGEVDAFLILALSVYVAPSYGTWVLAIGAARYVFLAGEWLLPWMRAPLPPRRWRRIVAALQGIVLTVAAAGVAAAVRALLAAALAATRRLSERGVRVDPWRRREQAAASGPAAATSRWAERPRPGARLAGARRAGPTQPLHARRVRATPARAARRGRAGRAAARGAAAPAGRGRGRAAKRARAGEAARRRLLHGVRPAVQPVDDSGYLGVGIDTLRIGVGR